MDPSASRKQFAQDLGQADLTLGPGRYELSEFTAAVVDHPGIGDPC
jgi:hypothetical protein